MPPLAYCLLAPTINSQFIVEIHIGLPIPVLCRLSHLRDLVPRRLLVQLWFLGGTRSLFPMIPQVIIDWQLRS